MGGLFKKKTISNTDNVIGALTLQNSTQGLPVPIVFGQTRIASNLLWYGDFTAIPSTTSQSSGKGGGTTQTSTSYTYTAAVVWGLCEGPAANANFVGQVWVDSNVTTAAAQGLTSFQGTYSQTPWPYLTTNHAGQDLAYRGNAYLCSPALALGSSSSLPNMTFEVQGLLGGADANVANVVATLLTDANFGVGWPSAQLGDLSNFFNYCAAANIVISPAYTSQTPMSSMLTDLLQIGNANAIFADGLLQIVPYADQAIGGWSPSLTVQYSLGYDDFIAAAGTDPVTCDRSRQADAYNQVNVECYDRSNQYNIYIAQASDQLAIETYGLRVMSTVTAHSICSPAIGRFVAQQILQRQLYIRNVYSFTLGWRYGRLDPMDIVAITDAKLGLVNFPVRIISIEEDANGNLAIQAEELSTGVSTGGVYSAAPVSGHTPAAGVAPGNAVAPVMFQPPLALTGGQPQVWIGSAGGANWGGAQVWVSHDNATYAMVGTLTSGARFGTLTANLPLVVDPDTTSTLSCNLSASSGVLTSAANSVADAGGTLSVIVGSNLATNELIDYSTANLTSAYNYNLTGYLRRARDGTQAQAHLTGAAFMRLDASVGAFDVAQSWFGTTIYVKLLSFNTVGGALQSLSAVNPYTFNVAAQVVTNGTGYAYTVDTSSTTNADPGAGKLRFDNAVQANAAHIYIDDTTADGVAMTTLFAGLGQVGLLDIRDVADTAKWATYTVTSATANSGGGYYAFGVAFKAGGVAFPNGDTVDITLSPTLGVTSVGLNLPATLFAANAAQVTSSGNLTQALASQNAAAVFAGPTSGNAAAPTFRALATTDIPPGANGQVLTMAAGAVTWRSPSITINAQSANYTLALSDFNTPTAIVFNSASNLVLTVPTHANVAAGNGSSVIVVRQGSGTVTVSAQNASVTTVNNVSSNTLRAQYSPAALFCASTDIWDLWGDTT